jgi:hypothetical protein
LLNSNVEVQLADFYQQNNQENSQRGGGSPKEGAA